MSVVGPVLYITRQGLNKNGVFDRLKGLFVDLMGKNRFGREDFVLLNTVMMLAAVDGEVGAEEVGRPTFVSRSTEVGEGVGGRTCSPSVLVRGARAEIFPLCGRNVRRQVCGCSSANCTVKGVRLRISRKCAHGRDWGAGTHSQLAYRSPDLPSNRDDPAHVRRHHRRFGMWQKHRVYAERCRITESDMSQKCHKTVTFPSRFRRIGPCRSQRTATVRRVTWM